MKICIKNINLELEDVPHPIIEICYSHNLPINFGCRIGMCGTCIVNITSGLHNTNPLSDSEKEFGLTSNQRMACQCTILGDVTIE